MRCACAAARLRTLGEQLLFKREDLVFGVEHFALVILQLRRGEALGVGQGLLALVIGRREVLVGARDFDVVAEDVVEAHLERLDAGACALARLDLRDVPGGRCWLQVAQFVEVGMEAGADGAAIGQVDGRLVGDGFAGSRSATSATSSRRPCRSRRRAACCVSKQRFSAGIFSSERPSASTSRGLATPMVILASRRSISRMPPSCLRNSARRMVCCSNSPTASRRCSISARSSEGRSRRWRSRRPPMPVWVWSRTASRVAAAVPRLAGESGSTSSRLRTVTASSTMESARS